MHYTALAPTVFGNYGVSLNSAETQLLCIMFNEDNICTLFTLIGFP